MRLKRKAPMYREVILKSLCPYYCYTSRSDSMSVEAVLRLVYHARRYAHVLWGQTTSSQMMRTPPARFYKHVYGKMCKSLYREDHLGLSHHLWGTHLLNEDRNSTSKIQPMNVNVRGKASNSERFSIQLWSVASRDGKYYQAKNGFFGLFTSCVSDCFGRPLFLPCSEPFRSASCGPGGEDLTISLIV